VNITAMSFLFLALLLELFPVRSPWNILKIYSQELNATLFQGLGIMRVGHKVQVKNILRSNELDQSLLTYLTQSINQEVLSINH
jgi:hypothetical protein